MEILFVILMLGDVYFIVYCRMMVHMRQAPQPARAGLAVAVSFPKRKDLDAEGMRYLRLYWRGWIAMAVILGGGLLWRYPYIALGLGDAR